MIGGTVAAREGLRTRLESKPRQAGASAASAPTRAQASPPLLQPFYQATPHPRVAGLDSPFKIYKHVQDFWAARGSRAPLWEVDSAALYF